MERKEFLAKLGISLAAVCAGCSIASCGNGTKAGDPAPTNNNNGGGGNNALTADLTTELKSVGQSKVGNGIIVVRIADGNTPAAFTAVQVACTHQGTAINYNNGQGIFICPNHGSQFSQTGAVLLGPATQSLTKYTVAINGSTLTAS
ncbi:Rieske (2Fe-2S) protein [Mucilaginibacter sp. RS28]|uniref:Rieske (2Fe-2S) protein n=1 Tax=Mucilaginibacter straminoryzae TaxID=2932774 RepID=A0A9X1XA54_9SPHI|nr:Rieske (2Fe-2S) protein [Mucilaginibacter straminoryzae]MCJ8210994.1 Rieske (2Fe-2S) protein [Mucilaginibacter straminoryzae]